MKAGARVALAVGAGYLLGRTKKMRLALMIAAAGATGRSGTSPGALLQGGLKQLGSSAEVTKVAELARDELLGAAKAAAVTAASRRIESLSGRLQDGGRLKDAVTSGGETAEAEDEDEDTGERGRAEEEEDEPERPVRRRTASRRGSGSSNSSGSSDKQETPRRTRTASRRTPVRRTGR